MINWLKEYIKKKNITEKYNVSKRYFVMNKKMVARGVFIGVFIAMIPMPAQMLAIFGFTFFMKFNFPIAIAMCWITNPFTMPFIYYIQYMTGSFILGIEPAGVELSIEWFNNNFTKIMIPLYFGAFLYSIVLSTLAYYAISFYWGNKKIRIR